MAADRSIEILRVCWGMSRPSQLALIGGVYALGATVGVAHGGTVAVEPIVGVGLPLLALSASVHYVNEYADYETDHLTDRTRFSGGSGALVGTDLPRSLPLRAAVVSLAAGVGLAATARLAVPVPDAVLVLLAAIVVLGWGYSVGPRFAWRGLGEVDNSLLGGLLLPLVGYATVTGTVTLEAALAFVPFTLLVFCNLLATQWPDREADGIVGKRTLAVRWEPGRLRTTYWLVAAASLGSLATLWWFGVLPTVVALASLLVVPLVGWGGHVLTRQRSPFPSVAAMVSLAALQLAGWYWLAV